MTKDASYNNPGAGYVLNSYAFHCKSLISVLQSYLPPGFDKSKIESIFTEVITNENHHNDILLLSETTEKIRKRVLISSTFATALKVKHVLRIFRELRQCKVLAP